MTPRDFAEYAALWREQIDPKELAELQAMATKIKRTARQRWLLDHLFGIFAVLCGLYALLYPAPLPIKLWMALFLVVVIWFMWRRRQIAEAARAIAIDDPKVFFEAAIENMRAEINLFTLSAWLAPPVFFSFWLLVGGFDQLYIGLRNILTLAAVKSAFILAISIPYLIYYIRDNIRLREQLRRLEAMRREWEEREPGEEP